MCMLVTCFSVKLQLCDFGKLFILGEILCAGIRTCSRVCFWVGLNYNLLFGFVSLR